MNLSSYFYNVKDVASTRIALTSFDFKLPRTQQQTISTLNEQGEIVPRLGVYEYTDA